MILFDNINGFFRVITSEIRTGTLDWYILAVMMTMKLPSYLLQNQYGIFYFRTVFPKPIKLVLEKNEFKRSLHTTDRKRAVHLARIFKVKTDSLFNLILKSHMNYSDAKMFLDKVAVDILSDFRNEIEETGPWGNRDGGLEYPEGWAELEADLFMKMRIEGEQVFKDYHPDTDEEIFIDFSGDMSTVLAVRKIAFRIIKDYQLNIEENQFERFCVQVAEMLISLHEKRWDYLYHMRGEAVLPYDAVSVASSNIVSQNTAEQQTIKPSPVTETTGKGLLLKDLFEKFKYSKVEVERSWRKSTADDINQFII